MNIDLGRSAPADPVLLSCESSSSIEERLDAFVERYGDLAFSGDEGRDFAHNIVQYPAMMVPNMQGQLMDCFLSGKKKDSFSVVDPFMGSGTILVEAQRRGIAFRGIDINPYAFLISHVKATKLDESVLGELPATIASAIEADVSEEIDHEFFGRSKWFREDVSQQLCRIRRCIKGIGDVALRRVLWACLGETVRVSSNSRTSTFKLHIRPLEKQQRPLDAVKTFNDVVKRAVGLLESEQSGRQSDAPTPTLFLGDSRDVSFEKADLLISSPPYGDNKTTVPYGQFSYLALQWMDIEDVQGASVDVVKNTHALDTQSLGGALKNALNAREELEARSSTLTELLEVLDEKEKDNGLKRVVAFYRDLDEVLARCVEFVKPGGYMVWTVGNRRVYGEVVPMDKILRELLVSRGCSFVRDLERVIPSKRMATKNAISSTMRSEVVVVVQNG